MTSSDFQLRIKQKALEIDSNAEVILYGSRARGEARTGSDWDILILTSLDSYKNKDIGLFIRKMMELELEFSEAISTNVIKKNDWYTKYKITDYFKNVNEDGLKL